MQEPWIHFCGSGAIAARQPILEAFQAAGTTPRALETDAPVGDGIVCFTAIDDDLCDFLRDVSRPHLQRIVAVPVVEAADCVLGAWRLLRTGVSDVLSAASPSDVVKRIKARLDRWHAVDALMQSDVVREKLIGGSPTWQSARGPVDVSKRAPHRDGEHIADRVSLRRTQLDANSLGDVTCEIAQKLLEVG
jgi:hypothetical protein